MNANEMRGAIAVRNGLRSPLKLVIEPSADETTIAPDQCVRIEFKGPQAGRIEVEVKGDVLVIYGWPGSVLADPVSEAPHRS